MLGGCVQVLRLVPLSRPRELQVVSRCLRRAHHHELGGPFFKNMLEHHAHSLTQSLTIDILLVRSPRRTTHGVHQPEHHGAPATWNPLLSQEV